MEDRTHSETLCIQGSQAEFDGRLDDARHCFHAAWAGAHSDRDRCIAAHYVAHLEDDAAVAHQWNLASMHFANLSDPQSVAAFMPSLLVNLGRTSELTGNVREAERLYALARQLGLEHSPSMLDSHARLRLRSAGGTSR